MFPVAVFVGAVAVWLQPFVRLGVNNTFSSDNWLSLDLLVPPKRLQPRMRVCVDMARLYNYQVEYIVRYGTKAGNGDAGMEMIAKHVAGLPGDVVVVRNGELRVREWVVPMLRKNTGYYKNDGVYTVPEGHVVVLNPGLLSLDSRYVGPVPMDAIVGRCWPLPWPKKDLRPLLDAVKKKYPGKYPACWLSLDSLNVPAPQLLLSRP